MVVVEVVGIRGWRLVGCASLAVVEEMETKGGRGRWLELCGLAGMVGGVVGRVTRTEITLKRFCGWYRLCYRELKGEVCTFLLLERLDAPLKVERGHMRSFRASTWRMLSFLAEERSDFVRLFRRSSESVQIC